MRAAHLDPRLHLQAGPIDLVIEAWGDQLAYDRARAVFPDILPGLVRELPLLKAPVHAGTSDPAGPVARRMVAATRPYAPRFLTPMAAVAGAVADHVLSAMASPALERAYVNNGGDIAVRVTRTSLIAGLVAELDRPALFGRIAIEPGMGVGGLATSGRGGRSFSLGIADAVTILAADAATADAAATMVANAVDIDHPAVRRAPASSRKDDSDLGDRLVTVGLGDLPARLVDEALDRGAREATALMALGRIKGAVLVLRGRHRVVGAAPMLEQEREE